LNGYAEVRCGQKLTRTRQATKISPLTHGRKNVQQAHNKRHRFYPTIPEKGEVEMKRKGKKQ